MIELTTPFTCTRSVVPEKSCPEISRDVQSVMLSVMCMAGRLSESWHCRVQLCNVRFRCNLTIDRIGISLHIYSKCKNSRAYTIASCIEHYGQGWWASLGPTSVVVRRVGVQSVSPTLRLVLAGAIECGLESLK